MAISEFIELSGLEKASVLLMALGASTSAQVLKHLDESEIEKLSGEIVKMRKADPELVEAVLAEFGRACASRDRGEVDGRDFVAQILEQAMGEEKASEFLSRAIRPGSSLPFAFLWDLEPVRIARLMAHEPAQIVAIVLSNLQSDKAAAVLSLLDPGIQAEVAVCICSAGQIEPEIISAIEESLQAKHSVLSKQRPISAGPRTLVDILSKAERSTEKAVLHALNNQSPSMGEQVRNMMFVFEDLPKLSDHAIRTILREFDTKDLCLAMKGADEPTKESLFRNMSDRGVQLIREDMELLGAVKVRDIETAQKKLEALVRRLLSRNEISMDDMEAAA